MHNAVVRYGTLNSTHSLEFGSGGGFLHDVIPGVITSDIVPVRGVETVIDAQHIPFRDRSLNSIYMTHVLHHIPNAELFFREANRVLAPGGIIAMVEVAATPFARFFFSNFHPEPFLPRAQHWTFNQENAMLDSNQALSWIIFKRDIQRFQTLFPEFEICEMRLLPWFSYFVSGGVTKPYLIPNFLTPLINGIDMLLLPLNRLFALHWYIIVRKRASIDNHG